MEKIELQSPCRFSLTAASAHCSLSLVVIKLVLRLLQRVGRLAPMSAVASQLLCSISQKRPSLGHPLQDCRAIIPPHAATLAGTSFCQRSRLSQHLLPDERLAEHFGFEDWAQKPYLTLLGSLGSDLSIGHSLLPCRSIDLTEILRKARSWDLAASFMTQNEGAPHWTYVCCPQWGPPI